MGWKWKKEKKPTQKEAVYNTDKTECLEIGWFKLDNGEIQTH